MLKNQTAAQPVLADGEDELLAEVSGRKGQELRSRRQKDVLYLSVNQQGGDVMKSSPILLTHGFLPVPPPSETMRDTLTDRRSAAHLRDPAKSFHEAAGGHDSRRDVAVSGAPQRRRARQTEARTADQCHLRIRRRQETDGRQ